MKKVLIFVLILLFLGCSSTKSLENGNEMSGSENIPEVLEFEPFFQNEQPLSTIDVSQIPKNKYKALFPIEFDNDLINFFAYKINKDNSMNKSLLYFDGKEYNIITMTSSSDIGDIKMTIMFSSDEFRVKLATVFATVLSQIALEHSLKEKENINNTTEKIAKTEETTSITDSTSISETIVKAKLNNISIYGIFTDGKNYYTIGGISLNKILEDQLKDKLNVSFFKNLNEYIKTSSTKLKMFVKEKND